MTTLGITGGIGSGKSVVCRLLSLLGIPIYYSDVEAKRLMCENPILKEKLKELLGEKAYCDGELNSVFIAERIFANSELLQRVNQCVHPVVIEDFFQWAKQQGREAVGVESALIYQCGLDQLLDKIILVEAPESMQIKRIVKRNSISKEQAEQRLESQNRNSPFLYSPDFIIHNDEKEPLIPQVLNLLKMLS